MIEKALPYVFSLLGSLVLTLILTPIVRELNRSLGMVDKPDPRRINKVPIPRGGGVAIVIGVTVPYLLLHFLMGRPALQGISDAQFYKMTALSVIVAIIGLFDDKFGMKPLVKLLGQLLVSFLVWAWADLGFSDVWPGLPMWCDCLLTVFWLTGAMNAFNLIDGLDGLASGIALIAALGMSGALFLAQNPQTTFFYLAFAGGLLGFLRYNYNPASVFLGDSGSMYIGFMLASLPLASHAPNSFLVSVGVPLLAMGVPIFDTSLAIVRRSLRRLLRLGSGDGKSDAVMTADSDHLHHRILRASGLSQRRTAWILYALTLALVALGLGGMCLESRAAGLWLAGITVFSIVIFRDLARIELFDAGLLLNRIAHDRNLVHRRRWARLSVPYYVIMDIAILTFVFFFCCWVTHLPITRSIVRIGLPVRVVSVFFCMVAFRNYSTIWSRALGVNYVRLALACLFGSLGAAVVIYYVPAKFPGMLMMFTILYALISFCALHLLRTLRMLVRDGFYSIDCLRIQSHKDVSRILVLGTGLRYRAFRREMVRATASNNRIIVGLLDDDLLLRNHYIGDLKVLGTLEQAPEFVNSLNVDAVVVACDVTPDRLSEIKRLLEPLGVKITLFSFSERDV